MHPSSGLLARNNHPYTRLIWYCLVRLYSPFWLHLNWSLVCQLMLPVVPNIFVDVEQNNIQGYMKGSTRDSAVLMSHPTDCTGDNNRDEVHIYPIPRHWRLRSGSGVAPALRKPGRIARASRKGRHGSSIAGQEAKFVASSS